MQARASMVNYRKTILNAVQQVDTSLDAYEAQEVRLEKLSAAMMAGERAVDLATRRYERGLTDFLNVVDAERQFYDLQEQYAAAQVDAGRAVRAAVQEPRRRLAELSVRSSDPTTSACRHCGVSTGVGEFGTVSGRTHAFFDICR